MCIRDRHTTVHMMGLGTNVHDPTAVSGICKFLLVLTLLDFQHKEAATKFRLLTSPNITTVSEPYSERLLLCVCQLGLGTSAIFPEYNKKFAMWAVPDALHTVGCGSLQQGCSARRSKLKGPTTRWHAKTGWISASNKADTHQHAPLAEHAPKISLKCSQLFWAMVHEERA
eukprot:1081900-Amphidinium_carterae.1